MRINKIILFPIVILLLTVSFAGVAAAQPSVVGQTPTQLTAVANVTTVTINTPFTINGTLSATGAPVGPSATITLQNSTDNSTWNNVTPTTATDANGNYTFSNSESAAGTYYYRTTYAGYGTPSGYGNATSAVVTVNVITIGTQLTATASITTTAVNTPFTINGTLTNATSVTGIAGATIQLQKNVSGTWTPTSSPVVTDANGAYSISTSEPAVGTYQYQTTYAGSATYTNATSNVVSVNVFQITTQLTATASITTTAVNTPFTINGTLSTSSGGITGATIQLQKNVSGTWTTVNTTTTDANGNYQFSISEPAAGTYYYRTTYAGYSTYFSPATSPVVTVNVPTIGTQLTAVANVTTVAANTPFTINGTLTNATSHTGIPSAPIQLQKNVSGTWTPTSSPVVTDANGAYSISTSEPAVGTYQYQTTYAGNATYGPATSAVVTVNVPTIGTQLTAATNLTSVVTNQNFTINGTLTDTSGNPIPSATITLQRSVSGTWTDAANTTTNAGSYQFSQNESAAATYYYRTTYAGYSSRFGNAASNTVTVTVTTSPPQNVTTPSSSPAATGNYLFVAGNDSALWYKTWNGATWSSATSLGGVLAANTGPAATSSGGVIDVFAHGTDNAVWYKTSNDGGITWSNWHSLGGVLATGSSPAATSSGGVIDVFAHGTDNAVWYRTTTSGWQPLGGVLATGSSPAATSPSTGVIDVFAHGTDNAVWYRTTTSGWQPLGGVLAANTGPAATSSGGVIDVFAHGTDNAVWYRTTTSGWHSIGGVLAANTGPAATSGSSAIAVFALGTDHAVWQTTTTSSGVWTSTGPW
jgi:hypothetical protein